jgi:hypothetical protein
MKKLLNIVSMFLFCLALLAWFYSLTLPAIIYQPNPNASFMQSQCGFTTNPKVQCNFVPVDYGHYVFQAGWLGIFMGTFAWYANVFGFLALCCFRKATKLSFIMALLAVIIGSTSVSFGTVWLDEGGVNKLYVDHLGEGFYVWELSFFLLALSCLVRLFNCLSQSRLIIFLIPKIFPKI